MTESVGVTPKSPEKIYHLNYKTTSFPTIFDYGKMKGVYSLTNANKGRTKSENPVQSAVQYLGS